MKQVKQVLLAASCALAITSGLAQADDKTITIGMVNLFYGAPYFAGMDVAVHQEADAYENIEVISTDAGFDAAKMASDIDDLLAKNVDGLIISAGPTETLPVALAAIEEAGIPVVFVDRLWKNTSLKTPWNWVGAQNDVMGAEIGEHLEKHLGGKGRGPCHQGWSGGQFHRHCPYRSLHQGPFLQPRFEDHCCPGLWGLGCRWRL